MDILRTPGLGIVAVNGVGGVTVPAVLIAGTHYRLVSNPALFLAISVGILVGRICVVATANRTTHFSNAGRFFARDIRPHSK